MNVQIIDDDDGHLTGQNGQCTLQSQHFALGPHGQGNAIKALLVLGWQHLAADHLQASRAEDIPDPLLGRIASLVGILGRRIDVLRSCRIGLRKHGFNICPLRLQPQKPRIARLHLRQLRLGTLVLFSDVPAQQDQRENRQSQSTDEDQPLTG